MQPEEKLINIKTATLAKECGFNWKCANFFGIPNGSLYVFTGHVEDSLKDHNSTDVGENRASAPRQSYLQKWIREVRKVDISIYSNAEGYLFSMSLLGGTDLGYSEYRGTNYGGTWPTYEQALEVALGVQLSYDIKEFEKVRTHWSNYVGEAFNKFNKVSNG